LRKPSRISSSANCQRLPGKGRLPCIGSWPGIPCGLTASVRLNRGFSRIDNRGMHEKLPDDLESERGNRIAYGEAGRLAEIRAEPFPSGHTSRSWGRMVQWPWAV
jgi:hypothetical protein